VGELATHIDERAYLGNQIPANSDGVENTAEGLVSAVQLQRKKLLKCSITKGRVEAHIFFRSALYQSPKRMVKDKMHVRVSQTKILKQERSRRESGMWLGEWVGLRLSR
jgi:hypothetical protein